MTPENPLEHALIAAASEPSARPTFYRLLLESALLIIDDGAPVPVGTLSTVLTEGTTLKIQTCNIDGVPHTPIFSSLTALRQAIDTERKYISMVGREMLTLLRGSHLILNPGLPHGKLFLPQEVEDVLSGTIFLDYSRLSIEKETPVFFGQPAEYPRHLTEALARLFQNHETVEAAYLAHCAYPSENLPHTMIGIDTSADWDTLVPLVMNAIRQVARPDDIVDVVQIDDSDPSRYLTEETEPFYTRAQ